MTKIASEYARYQTSLVMKELALAAHGEHYQGQTSSASYAEISKYIRSMSLPKNARVLDAGCGNGTFSLSIAKEFSFFMKGIDLSFDLIQEASYRSQEMKLENICEFQVKDFVDLSNERKSYFDAIISIGSLYWGQSLFTTLSSWRHVCHKGSNLLIFANLLYNPLTQKEKAAINETYFIPAILIQSELAKNHWEIVEWHDATVNYSMWLDRWCEKMEERYKALQSEMGENNAYQLYKRFNTYKILAEKKTVKRIIINGVLSC